MEMAKKRFGEVLLMAAAVFGYLPTDVWFGRIHIVVEAILLATIMYAGSMVFRAMDVSHSNFQREIRDVLIGYLSGAIMGAILTVSYSMLLFWVMLAFLIVMLVFNNVRFYRVLRANLSQTPESAS
jgi:hypothetical protein